MGNWTRAISDAFARAGHAPDIDIVEELAQHAEAEYARLRAEGGSADAARIQVDALVLEWTRDGGRLRHRSRRSVPATPSPETRVGIAGLAHDVRYAIRLIRRQPLPATVAATTMGLGIAASTLLFSITWGVLMKPLPWPDADRLVRLEERREGATREMAGIMTNGPYLALSESPATIDALAGYRTQTVTMTGTGDPERIRIASATASLFPLLRARPERGAFFSAGDETAKVAVLSYGLWRRRFGGADDVLGRSILFNGTAHTVVAVLPADFGFPDEETEAWIPLRIRPTTTPDGGSWVQIFSAVARLAPGATPAQVSAEATARARSAPGGGMAAVAVFGRNGLATITARPMLDALTADVRPALIVLLIAVGLLVATATANIANIQLARAATRTKEMAVRAAIGANAVRLARQTLVETLVVGFIGGAIGLALASALHRVLPALLPASFPRAHDITLDWRIAAFALGVALTGGLLAGLAPALQARRLNLVGALVNDPSASGRAYGRSRVARLRTVIMTAQVMAACVLLVGASLLTRTFVAMLQADRGFDATNVLTAHLATPGGLFTGQRRAEIVTGTLERLRARHDVVAAGMSTSVPLLSGDAVLAFTMPAREGNGEPTQVQSSYRMISPGYLEAMGMKIVAGRAFDDGDSATSAPVLLVNETFARRYLPADPVGRRIPAALIDGKPDWEIAGVVQDVRMDADLLQSAQPEILVSYRQFPDGMRGDPVFAVRTRQDPVALIETVRQIVREQDATATLESVMTMEQRVSASLSRPRLYAVVLAGFGAFALSIAGVGLFGVLSYGVAQRSKELGIRTALGATPGRIVRLVVGEGLAITGAGIVAGLAVSFAASRSLSSFLYGVQPHDRVTLLAVPGVLVLVAALACFLPARRASHIDPLRVLKGGG